MRVIITDIESFDMPVSADVQIVSPATGSGNIKNCIGCFGTGLQNAATAGAAQWALAAVVQHCP